MPTAENAQLQYEAGQQAVAMSALTDSGDAKTFESTQPLWSKKSGFAPVVRPDGLITGGEVVPAVAAGNNNVDVAALSCYLAGVKVSVAADADVAITRAATDVAVINSITVTSAGAIAAVKGTDSSDASFSDTRGAAGGPPYIPVGDIEIAQVRVTSNTAAVIASTDIFDVVGLHKERWDNPLWDEEAQTGCIVFNSALPLIHTGDVTKGVYASYAGPIFANLSLASDFVPPENSFSVTSTQIYGTTLGATTTTLNQGSFTAYLNDGVSDAMVSLKGELLWFKFFPDRFKTSYILAQGILGISRTFPAGDSIQAACTISSEEQSSDVIV